MNFLYRKILHVSLSTKDKSKARALKSNFHNLPQSHFALQVSFIKNYIFIYTHILYLNISKMYIFFTSTYEPIKWQQQKNTHFWEEHWKKIRTNNMIERLNREIRRRTRVVGTFPDDESALMMVCARLRHVVSTRWGSKKYMDMKHLYGFDVDNLLDWFYLRRDSDICEKYLTVPTITSPLSW